MNFLLQFLDTLNLPFQKHEADTSGAGFHFWCGGSAGFLRHVLPLQLRFS